jgi:hypothetical protein
MLRDVEIEVKPPHRPGSAPAAAAPAGFEHGGQGEQPVGTLVHKLVEDGKAYAKAEVDLYKTMATTKAKGMVMPAALFGGAFLLLQAAVTVLAVATFLALLPAVGPFFAGLLAFMIFAGLAGLLAFVAVKKLKALP